MNGVLGDSAGNGLEVTESIEFLTLNAQNPRLKTCVEALAVELLQLCGLYNTQKAAGEAVNQALTSGKAAEIFAKMVHAHGGKGEGTGDILNNPER